MFNTIQTDLYQTYILDKINQKEEKKEVTKWLA